MIYGHVPKIYKTAILYYCSVKSYYYTSIYVIMYHIYRYTFTTTG